MSQKTSIRKAVIDQVIDDNVKLLISAVKSGDTDMIKFVLHNVLDDINSAWNNKYYQQRKAKANLPQQPDLGDVL
jgi:hypothetical protein